MVQGASLTAQVTRALGDAILPKVLPSVSSPPLQGVTVLSSMAS